MPTVVALTARSAERRAAAKDGSPSATAATAPAPVPASRLATASADDSVRLPIVTRRAPARMQANTTAWAAPPAPATTTSRPARDRPSASSTPARNPGASVLKPTSRPSAVRTTLFTAPIAVASGSTSSQRPATTFLYGAVTPSPSQSGPRAAATASSTASASISSSSYRPSIPAAANAASCMTGEWRRRRGLPRSATRRVIAARGSAGDGPARPWPGTARWG